MSWKLFSFGGLLLLAGALALVTPDSAQAQHRGGGHGGGYRGWGGHVTACRGGWGGYRGGWGGYRAGYWGGWHGYYPRYYAGYWPRYGRWWGGYPRLAFGSGYYPYH